MKTNAVKFNGPVSFIAQEAIAINDHVKSQIKSNRDELTALEEEVELIMSGKTKHKKQKTDKKKKVGNVGSRNMADVGGISVDLGNLSPSMQVGDDTDDSDSLEFLGNL